MIKVKLLILLLVNICNSYLNGQKFKVEFNQNLIQQLFSGESVTRSTSSPTHYSFLNFFLVDSDLYHKWMHRHTFSFLFFSFWISNFWLQIWCTIWILIHHLMKLHDFHVLVHMQIMHFIKMTCIILVCGCICIYECK